MTWLNRFKHKVAEIIGPREHLNWSTWETIWNSLKIKESLKNAPWVEFELGAKQSHIFEKINFGLLESNRPTLGKITLENSNLETIHLFKANQEICSVQAKEVLHFWSELRRDSYLAIQTAIAPYLNASRLKIANDGQVQEEEKILQWIKTSLLPLKAAIKRAQSTTSGEFVTARILIGRLPLQESLHIIVHCFNLEIVLLSTDTKAWKLLIYDHKDRDVMSHSPAPSLNSLVELQLSSIWLELDQLIKSILKI